MSKLDSSKTDTVNTSSERKGTGMNKRKNTRRVEIGWIHNGRQVRKRTGGGTRKIDFARTDGKEMILEQSKQLFFPNGVSTKGNLSDFKMDILDFKETPLPDDVTISECYELFKTGILTFYFHTYDKPKDDKPLNAHKVSATASKPAETVTSSTEELPVFDPSTVMIDDDLLDNQDDVLPDIDDSEIIFNFNAQLEPENSNITAREEANAFVDTPTLLNTNPVLLVIHRGVFAFKEICSSFKDPSIMGKAVTLERILPNGEVEKAADAGGVLRDAISEFWDDFYNRCTTGRIAKVPCIRHDFGEEDWKAIGRVLIYGWKELKYWPIQLAKTFLSHCLYTHQISNNEMKEDFYRFISLPDADVFKRAAVDYDSVNEEDILEALESYDCKTKITAQNFNSVLIEISHRVLVQSPCYVAECWREVFAEFLLSHVNLDDIYKSLSPTNAAVSRLLALTDPGYPQDELVLKYLRRYVKELDEKKLGLFLRFCCGSDIMNMDKIEIQLSQMSSFERRPIAHTCGCLLQLGRDYANYMEFRNEFDQVLESNIWIMDVV